MSSAIAGAGAELENFIRLAREIFHDEPWDQVHHYIERAWNASQLAGGATWTEVQSMVRAEWE